MTMRIGTWLVLLICCAGLAACTAAAPTGPQVTVTTPSVGRPPAPDSAQAALSREAFTPYAGLGASTDDGLAPGETYDALHTECMNTAGYGQYAASTPFSVRTNRGLAFAQPYGPWGYLGTAQAAQDGFDMNTPEDGAQNPGLPGTPAASLPSGAQAATGKCINIVAAFNNAQFATSMAGIETMNDDISTDVVSDPEFKQATRAWSACMAAEGESSPDADTLALRELTALGLRGPTLVPGSGSGPTAAQDKAQIAVAVTDADCTTSTDLAGIYFAVQASYEQQVVSANAQALAAAVREYKAAYARELGQLPRLLATAPTGVNFGPSMSRSPAAP
jgi:hypothetical protein